MLVGNAGTGFGLGFFHVTLKTRNKRKCRHTGLHQNENFRASQRTTKEAKKQRPDPERVFVNHFSGKRLVPRAQEEFLQLGNNREKQKKTNLCKNGQSV